MNAVPAEARHTLPSPRAALEARLAVKVLDAWLQNRHQTLVPLSVNLRRLEAAQLAAVLRMVAVALTAGLSNRERVANAKAWLARVGADTTSLRELDRAIEHPPPLSDALRDLSQQRAEVLAYAACVSVLDGREAANRLFLEFLAARLALPASAVRGISRRFRH